MKKLFILLIVALFATVAAGCGGGKAPESKDGFKANMKLATAVPTTHPYNEGGRKFAELIKERTNGRIQITVYPEGQLGKGEREFLEALQQGAIDLYVGSTGPVGNFSPSMNIVDIPFLFRDHAHVDKVLDGPIGRQLMDDLDKSGFKGLAFWENGFRHLTNSRTAVKTPADAQGLKIRVMENKVHLLAWKTAGVNPTPMAWGEVYSALQQKVIDGQENPIAITYSTKFWEIQKHLTLTQHVYSPALIIISKKHWDQMPKADQDLFQKTALEVAKFQRDLLRNDEIKQVAECEKNGMLVVREVDKELWRKAMQPAFDEFAKQFGKDKIDAILNTK